MEEKRKACCLIGQLPEEFLWDYSKKDLIEWKHYNLDRFTWLEELIWEGYNYFICGCERGADMDFAEDIIYFRKKSYPKIKLEIVLRYADQGRGYEEKERKRYKKILSKADKVTVVGDKDDKCNAEKKKQYVADHAEMGLVVWNSKMKGETYRMLSYVTQQNKRLEFVNLTLCLKERREMVAKLMRYAQTHFIHKKSTADE